MLDFEKWVWINISNMQTDNSSIGNRDMVASDLSAVQLYVELAGRRAAEIAGIPGDMPTLPIRKIGVIGAGTMGGGIAMNFLNAGIPVIVAETKSEALERGLATIRRNYDNSA